MRSVQQGGFCVHVCMWKGVRLEEWKTETWVRGSYGKAAANTVQHMICKGFWFNTYPHCPTGCLETSVWMFFFVFLWVFYLFFYYDFYFGVERGWNLLTKSKLVGGKNDKSGLISGREENANLARYRDVPDSQRMISNKKLLHNAPYKALKKKKKSWR